MSVQIIEKDGKPEWVVIPFSEYKRLQEALEDTEDTKDIKETLKALREGKEMTIPAEVTFAIIDGVNPVRAWREHKQIKMNELAKRAGISAAYLSQIEKNKRNPTINTLKAIAKELQVDIEVLI